MTLFVRLLFIAFVIITNSLRAESATPIVVQQYSLNQMIPDNDSTGTYVWLPVYVSNVIADIGVSINITHPYIGDLEMSLYHPDGTQVLLHNREGGSSDNIIKTYGWNGIEISGLQNLAGRSTLGDWFLGVKDLAGADIGIINSVTLSIYSQEYVTPPPNPSSLTSVPISSNSAYLDWNSQGGTTTGFYITYRQGSSAPLDCQGGVDTYLEFTGFSEYTAAFLSPGNEYSFRVCSTDNAGTLSSGITSTVRIPGLPPNPNGLTSNVLSSNSIQLSWQSGGGETQSFIIAYQPGFTPPTTCNGGTIQSTAATSLQVSGLVEGQTYGFRVCAKNNVGELSSGITTSATPSSPPQILGVYIWKGDENPILLPAGSGMQQLATIPYHLLGGIAIQFSQDVTVSQGSLEVKGVKMATYPTGNYYYDENSFTAYWGFNAPTSDHLQLFLKASGDSAVRNQLGLFLDGEWDNPLNLADVTSDTFPSGNGNTGGDFRFNVSYLTGDMNQDRTTNIGDVLSIRSLVPHSAIANPQADLDFNGVINIADVLLARSFVPLTLPVQHHRSVIMSYVTAGLFDGDVDLCLNIKTGLISFAQSGGSPGFIVGDYYTKNALQELNVTHYDSLTPSQFSLPGDWSSVRQAIPTVSWSRRSGGANPDIYSFTSGDQRCVHMWDGGSNRPGAVDFSLNWQLEVVP